MNDRADKVQRRDTDSVGALAELLGVEVGDPRLLGQAVTHKSYANEHPGEGSHNERLEFLGDAVVDLAVGLILMEKYPAATEGELSQLRAALVDERGLLRVARSLDLGAWLRLGRGEELSGGRDKSSLLADAYEAVAAAVFLTCGWNEVLSMVRRHFGDLMGDVAELMGRDFKTALQESFQRQHLELPTYEIVAESGPDHDKRFSVEVRSSGETIGAGRGRNKKLAEQAAARDALRTLEEG